MKHLKYIGGVLLMLVVVVLIVQNHEAMSTQVTFRVHSDLLSFNHESPQMTVYHIITIAFLFGVIISGVYGIIERFRLKKEIKDLINTTREKDKELISFRNLAVTTEDISSDSPIIEKD
ncbi:MAG: LapA family protein [Desulfatiglandales bacterium]|jgi:uncharacterized integral membrane protein|nr:LapA family protein [Desulfatiglandales bacterium]